MWTRLRTEAERCASSHLRASLGVLQGGDICSFMCSTTDGLSSCQQRLSSGSSYCWGITESVIVCSLLLHSPLLTAAARPSQPAAFPELQDRRQAQAGPSAAAAVLQQGSQAEARCSSAPPLCPSRMHRALLFTGPSVWQLSSTLNLLFEVTSVLYPEGMEEQMQPVKSGFNSPASFNFLPCLLINESALAALGIQRFSHIQETSMWWNSGSPACCVPSPLRLSVPLKHRTHVVAASPPWGHWWSFTGTAALHHLRAVCLRFLGVPGNTAERGRGISAL